MPDAETRELMVDFYRRLRRGVGRAEALRQAQRRISEKTPSRVLLGRVHLPRGPESFDMDRAKVVGALGGLSALAVPITASTINPLCPTGGSAASRRLRGVLPFQLLVAALGGWIHREQADVIAFLR